MLNIKSKDNCKVTDTKVSFTAKYRKNYVAFLAVLLFVLIIIGEITLATVIPVAMRNENLMAEEAARNDLLLLFDKTRSLCNSISGKNAQGKDDNLIAMEKQLLSDVLDRFARYMREEGDQMTPEEVIKVRNVITELYKVASRLSKGKSYSRENRVDTSTYVNKLLKQTNGETLRNEKAQ